MGRPRLAQGFVELKNIVGRGEVTSPLRRDGLVILLFLALTAVMTNPLVLHIANAVEDKQDALLNTWIIAWVGHALITNPLNLFNANIFYPYPNTLAYSETMLPQALFALPFNLAFDNTILGYNLVLLASFLLAAYAMYLFVFDLTRSRGAGIIAGTIFAFNPYNLGNLAQVQLLSFGWMPLAMLWLRRLLKSTVDSQQSTVRNFRFSIFDFRLAFLFAIFFSLQALSSFYYAFLAGFAVVLYTVWHFLIYRLRSSALVGVLFSAILIAILVIPFFIPYLQVQREMGFERQVSESEPFSASLKLYTEVAPQNVLYGNWLAPKQLIYNGGYPLDNLFPGIIAIALAIAGIAASKQRDKYFYFLLLAFAFLLSLGPRLFLAPNVGTDLNLPYRWLYDIFPLMKALRAPVRFDALVIFALAMLAGLGVTRLLTADRRPLTAGLRLRSTVYCLLLTVLISLEYFAFPAAAITPVPVWNEIPEYVRWLRAQPPGVVLELPMIANDATKPLDLTTQYLSTYHWHSTPDGYSGFNPKSRDEITDEMKSLPGERAISLLQAFDVRYLLSPCNALNRAGDLALLQSFESKCIYSIVPREQDASQLSASLYLTHPAAPNQNYSAYIIVQNRATHTFAFKPTDAPQIQVRWNDNAPQSIAASFPLVISQATVIPITLTAPTQTGNYKLSLRASSPAIGDWNLYGNVEVKNEEPAREVVLPIGISSQATFKSHYTAGEDVLVDLNWLAFGKIDGYYSASVRVIDAKGNKILNVDREPAGRTFLWRPGDAIPDRFALTLPPTLPLGDYTIQVLMYQAEQNIDALLLDQNFAPQKSLTVGIFTVK